MFCDSLLLPLRFLSRENRYIKIKMKAAVYEKLKKGDKREDEESKR